MIDQLRTFGVATGSFIRNLFARHGVVTEGFVWDYRPSISRNTFEPHRALHGTEVSGLNDSKLANPLNFPRMLYFYPGDHQGDRCMLRPVMRQERQRG
jgi:hypothetical protein